MARDALSALSLIWSVQQALILSFAKLASPFDKLQATLVGLTVLSSGWPPFLCFALVTRIYANITVFPNGWESLFWCAETDLALLLAIVVQMVRASRWSIFSDQRNAVVQDASLVVRWQLAGWYLSAAFFKLNSSFFDHRYSCASPYLAQLLAAYLPQHLATPADLATLVPIAPLMVVVGELALSIALLAAASGRGGKLAIRVGVTLALLLHFGIAITPPPNNIGAFSVIMAARLPAFANGDALLRATSLPSSASELVAWAGTLGVAAVAASAAARATASGGSGSAASEGDAGQMSIMFFGGLDWSVPTLVVMSLVLLRALFMDTGVTGPRRTLASHFAQKPSSEALGHRLTYSSQSSAYAQVWAPLLITLAWLHGFAGPILGLQDLGSSNMYGNLRLLGGSNHYLTPLNLLQLSGGIVRIESSTSHVLNALYPGEISSVFTPRAIEVLRSANHTGRQFNFAMGRVLGSWALPPPRLGGRGSAFVRFTVPALELRRMLAEARAAGQPFELVFTELDGRFGDEAWRAKSHGRRKVRVREDPVKGQADCVVLSERGAPACGPSDLPNQPPLSPWELALGVWNPHPILPGEHDEMHCFGP